MSSSLTNPDRDRAAQAWKRFPVEIRQKILTLVIDDMLSEVWNHAVLTREYWGLALTGERLELEQIGKLFHLQDAVVSFTHVAGSADILDVLAQLKEEPEDKKRNIDNSPFRFAYPCVMPNRDVMVSWA